MRTIISAALLVLAILPAWGAVHAAPGTKAERVSRASQVDQGYGAVILSIRSELYLDDPLHLYFLREGGSRDNDHDVIRFERRQGWLSVGNDTLYYQVRGYQLPVGTYRLIAHGMNCPTIPAEDERCLIEVRDILGSEELSRPSRGYGEEAPRFEVRSGTVTFAGDFVLTARNRVEWAEIPAHELRKVQRRYAEAPVGPAPEVPEDFTLKYAVFPRSYSDDARRRY